MAHTYGNSHPSTRTPTRPDNNGKPSEYVCVERVYYHIGAEIMALRGTRKPLCGTQVSHYTIGGMSLKQSRCFRRDDPRLLERNSRGEFRWQPRNRVYAEKENRGNGTVRRTDPCNCNKTIFYDVIEWKDCDCPGEDNECIIESLFPIQRPQRYENGYEYNGPNRLIRVSRDSDELCCDAVVPPRDEYSTSTPNFCDQSISQCCEPLLNEILEQYSYLLPGLETPLPCCGENTEPCEPVPMQRRTEGGGPDVEPAPTIDPYDPREAGICIQQVTWEMFFYLGRDDIRDADMCPSGKMLNSVSWRIQSVRKSSLCLDPNNTAQLNSWRSFTCGNSQEGHKEEHWRNNGTGWKVFGCKSQETECDCITSNPYDACEFVGSPIQGSPGPFPKEEWPRPGGIGFEDKPGGRGRGWYGKAKVPKGICLPEGIWDPDDGPRDGTLPQPLMKQIYEFNKEFIEGVLEFLPCCDCHDDEEPTPPSTKSTTTTRVRGKWRKMIEGTTSFEVYQKGDVVEKDGVSYVARKTVSGKIDPATSSEVTYDALRDWDLLGGRPTKIDGGFF